MKKLMTTLVCVTLSTSLFARIRTVNNIDSSAQYTRIQAACDASISGDSIYVSDSPNAYDAFTINNKKLLIFGPGWSPYAGGIASIPGCTVTGSVASGTELHGLTFTSTIQIQTADINNLRFIRNRFQGIQISFAAAVRDYLFEGNWFDRSYLYNPTQVPFSNFTVRNNIFYGSTNVYYLKGTNVSFNHNLWYGGGACFTGCQNIILSNNIFVNKDLSGTILSIFNNNITFNCTDDAPWNANNNKDAGGNLAGQYPQMASQSSVNNNVNNPLLDFTVSAGPANNTGSDGKDMGLLYEKGGSANWSRSRAARLPYISKLNISNQSIFKNGKIYFTVQAKSN